MWQSFWPMLINGTWTFCIHFFLFLLLLFLSNMCFLGSIWRWFWCHCLCCKQEPIIIQITQITLYININHTINSIIYKLHKLMSPSFRHTHPPPRPPPKALRKESISYFEVTKKDVGKISSYWLCVCVIYLVLFLGKNYSEVCLHVTLFCLMNKQLQLPNIFVVCAPAVTAFIFLIKKSFWTKTNLLFIYYFFYVFCLHCIFQMSWEPSCLLNQIVPHFVLSHVPFYCLQYGWPSCEADSS